MKRNLRFYLVSGATVALALLILFFLLRLSMRSLPEVALAQPDDTANSGSAIANTRQDAIRRIEVTPETVQLVIERLARPDNYSRTVTIERHWGDSTGESVVETFTADGWTRLDAAVNGTTRHVITGEEKSYIWYGDERAYYSGAAALSADEEENIPTYEDILRLPTGMIAAADYRTRETVNCIYVETKPDASGYAERFWIAVDNGLLVAAERLHGESVVYSMTGMEISTNDVTAESFTLPDETVLYDPNAEEENTENEG